MSIEIWLVTGLVLALAWANGANDIAKGVATLVGNGTANAKKAVLWGTLWTFMGGLVAMIWGAALVKVFSSGFLSSEFNADLGFVACTIAGAAGWVLLATRMGLPVSTTHALLGGVVGSALAMAGTKGLQMAAVAQKAMLPLLLSPLIAIVLCALLLLLARYVARKVPVWTPGCCSEEAWRSNPFICAKDDNHAVDNNEFLRVSSWAGRTWLALHWLSSGLTSFARGLNDVPKIAAFLILAVSISPQAKAWFGEDGMLSIFLVTVVMAVGCLWGGFKVLQLLAHQVVPLDASRGLVANIGTSLLVLVASPLGIPVSTTHVSTGSLMGVRWLDRIRPKQGDALKPVLFAWLVTLPVAAGLSAFSVYFI